MYIDNGNKEQVDREAWWLDFDKRGEKEVVNV